MKYLIVEMYISKYSERCDDFIHKLKTEEYDACIFYAPSEWEYWFFHDFKNSFWMINEISGLINLLAETTSHSDHKRSFLL